MFVRLKMQSKIPRFLSSRIWSAPRVNSCILLMADHDPNPMSCRAPLRHSPPLPGSTHPPMFVHDGASSGIVGTLSSPPRPPVSYDGRSRHFRPAAETPPKLKLSTISPVRTLPPSYAPDRPRGADGALVKPHPLIPVTSPALCKLPPAGPENNLPN